MRVAVLAMVIVAALMLLLPAVGSATPESVVPSESQTVTTSQNNPSWVVALLAMLGLATSGNGGVPVARVPEPAAITFLSLAALPFVIRRLRR